MIRNSVYDRNAELARKILRDYELLKKLGKKKASGLPSNLRYLSKSYVGSVIIGLGRLPEFEELRKKLTAILPNVLTYKNYMAEFHKQRRLKKLQKEVDFITEQSILNELSVAIQLDEGWRDWAAAGPAAAAGMIGLSALKGGNLKGADVPKNQVASLSKDLQAKSSEISLLDKKASDYIGQWEGKFNKVYLDTADKPTIGIGHYLSNTPEDRNLIEKLFGTAVNYDRLLSGKQSLTDNQIDKLFSVDVKVKEKVASNKIKDYNNYPIYVKNAIINGLYRGDLGPRTISLMNAGEWNKVASEYLNHNNAKSGPDQIKRRMKTNALAFVYFAKQQQKNEYFGFNYYF